MAQQQQLVWLVTGCSSGFGAEFVKSILQRGDKAIATARKVETLRPLADLGAATMQFDVSSEPAEIYSKVEEASRIYGRIDVLIANAGYVQCGPVEEIPVDLVWKILRTNTIANLLLVQAIMPIWRAQKNGFLVVNSSMNAHWTVQPNGAPYDISKAALDKMTIDFAAETADLGYIKTLIIRPGMTRTEVTAAEKHNFVDPPLARPELGPTKYRAMHDAYAELGPILHKGAIGDAAKGAEIVVDIVKGEGVAKGRQPPLWLPFGSDALKEARQNAEETLRVCKEWEDVILQTDYEQSK